MKKKFKLAFYFLSYFFLILSLNYIQNILYMGQSCIFVTMIYRENSHFIQIIKISVTFFVLCVFLIAKNKKLCLKN